MPLVTVPAPSFYEASAPPAPLPLLTAETDSYALSTAGQSIYYEEVDPDRVKRTARVSFAVPTTPPCSKARQLPSLTIPQARSATPSDVDADRNSTSGSDTSDDSDSSNSSASDIDEDLKITKPPGEAGRPGRGGYSLEQVLSWPPTRMKQFQVDPIAAQVVIVAHTHRSPRKPSRSWSPNISTRHILSALSRSPISGPSGKRYADPTFTIHI